MRANNKGEALIVNAILDKSRRALESSVNYKKIEKQKQLLINIYRHINPERSKVDTYALEP